MGRCCTATKKKLTFASILMCRCALVCHLTFWLTLHVSPFHISCQTDDMHSDALQLKQQKHYVGTIEPHLCRSLLNPPTRLQYLSVFVTRPRPMVWTLFPARSTACLWSQAMSPAVPVWLCAAVCEAIVLYARRPTRSRQWSRVNDALKKENALQIFRQNWPFGSRNCTYLVIITTVT